MAKLFFVVKFVFVISIFSCSHTTTNSAAYSSSQVSTKTVMMQKCEGGSTPVVDANWQPLGCNKAEKNKVKVNDSCEGFAAGDQTTDVKGERYVCTD